MKRILLALFLIPSVAFAGPEAIENDLITDPKTGTYILGRMNEDASVITATEGDAIAPSLNSKGQLMCSINSGVASATNPIKLEDSAAASGDALMGVAHRVNSGAATLAADGDYTTPAVNALGSTFIDANVLLQGSTALGLLKREDEASTDQAAGPARRF